MFVKTCLIAAALSIAAGALADSSADSPWLHKWSDVQIYIKPKTGFIGNWDQEMGLQATLFRKGQTSVQTYFGYDPTYNIRFDQKPRFVTGFQFNYLLTKQPSKFGIYTKIKASPLPYTYKDESGFTGRLYTSNSFYVSASLAYVFTIPFSNGAKPQFLGLLNIQIPL